MEQPDLLRYAFEALRARGVRYMLVGSMASSVYGEPRSTLDIDIVVDFQTDDVDWLCSVFAAPEFYLSRDAVRLAIEKRKQFNVIHPASGNKIDFMLSQFTEWGRMQLERRRQEIILPGMVGFAAAPEDLIISKMLYYQEGGSEKHLRDCAGMLKISGPRIDRLYVGEWAEKLRLAVTWSRILACLEPTTKSPP